MTTYTVDIKAFFNVTVHAGHPEEAKTVAHAFIESMMEAGPEAIRGYNSGLPLDALGTIALDQNIAPDINGDSVVLAVGLTIPTFDQLTKDYEVWLRQQPASLLALNDTSADALLHEDLTPAQRRFLSRYVMQWEEREKLDRQESEARACIAEKAA